MIYKDVAIEKLVIFPVRGENTLRAELTLSDGRVFTGDKSKIPVSEMKNNMKLQANVLALLTTSFKDLNEEMNK